MGTLGNLIRNWVTESICGKGRKIKPEEEWRTEACRADGDSRLQMLCTWLPAPAEHQEKIPAPAPRVISSNVRALGRTGA